MGHKNIYLKILVNALIAILFLLFIIFVLPRLLGFFWPFVVGWIISMIANPLVRFLEKKVKILRKHSSAIIIVLVLGAVMGLLYWGISSMLREGVSLARNLPEIYENMERELNIAWMNIEDRITFLPQVSEYIDHFGENMGELITNSINKLEGSVMISSAGTIARNVAEGVLLGIITILSSYFFIAERENLVEWMTKRTPIELQKQFHVISNNFLAAIGGYFKAQLKIMVLIFGILFVGFSILGVDYSALIALIIAFLDFLPIFGTGTAMWPWALYEVITGNYIRAIFIMVIYLVCQLVRQLVQPKLVGDSVGLSPLATLFFMFVGYRVNGVFGMILGIPIGMVLVSLNSTGVFDNLIRGAKIIIHDLNNYRKF